MTDAREWLNQVQDRRLRAAADVQDENAKWMDVSDPDTYYEKQRYEAEAALLRAVADQRDVVPFGVLGAANTLADKILGEE